jgi:hypothetical protein
MRATLDLGYVVLLLQGSKHVEPLARARAAFVGGKAKTGSTDDSTSKHDAKLLEGTLAQRYLF